LVAAGEAARLGILDRCLGEDLALVPIGNGAPHSVACHART
jgi:hypothetical protein